MHFRRLFCVVIATAFAWPLIASAERPTPISQKAPAFPAECATPDREPGKKDYVLAIYNIEDDGGTSEVRATNSTDPCFEKATLSAISQWRYEAHAKEAKYGPQSQLAFVFEPEKNTRLRRKKKDNPIKRYPPRFPGRCQKGASADNYVTILFDVTEKGRTTNLRVTDTTNSCFNKAAIGAVSKWRYRPIEIDDQRFGRTDVDTIISFHYEKL